MVLPCQERSSTAKLPWKLQLDLKKNHKASVCVKFQIQKKRRHSHTRFANTSYGTIMAFFARSCKLYLDAEQPPSGFFNNVLYPLGCLNIADLYLPRIICLILNITASPHSSNRSVAHLSLVSCTRWCVGPYHSFPVRVLTTNSSAKPVRSDSCDCGVSWARKLQLAAT